jgi:hypothetical protein
MASAGSRPLLLRLRHPFMRDTPKNIDVLREPATKKLREVLKLKKP